MRRYKLLTSAAACVVFLSGCGGIFMPYESDFRCNKGVGGGRCASMQENYFAAQGGEAKTAENIKTIENNGSKNSEYSCQKCEDMAEAIWQKQRKLEKSLKRGE